MGKAVNDIKTLAVNTRQRRYPIGREAIMIDYKYKSAGWIKLSWRIFCENYRALFKNTPIVYNKLSKKSSRILGNISIVTNVVTYWGML